MEIVFLRQAYRFIKKADKGLKEKIKLEVLQIKEDPRVGKLLNGKKLKGVRSHRFAYSKTQYRIAYKIENDLIIVFIASRENFYRDLTN